MGLRGNTIQNQPVLNIEGYLPSEETSFYKAQDTTSGVVAPKPSSGAIVRIPKKELPNPLDTPMSLGEIPAARKEPTTPEVIQEEAATARQLAALQAGAQFFADVFNANSAYAAASGEARLNILQARNQAADALYRGRQARMEAESEGRQVGESALLAMAVQGQDVSGAAVQKIQGSYEAMGVFNGMREEINAVREALGYQLQEVAYDYQIRNADIARRSAIIGSGINFIASGLGAVYSPKDTGTL